MMYVENRLKDAELLFIENCKNMRHYPLTAFGVRMIFFDWLQNNLFKLEKSIMTLVQYISNTFL